MNPYYLYRLFFIVLLTMLLAACSSQPYKRLTTPSISGTLTINHQAAQGITVYISRNGDDKLCYKAAAETLTDANGDFHFNSIKEQTKHTTLSKHFLDEWNICALHNNQRIHLYDGDRYGTGSVSSSLELKCELYKSPLNKKCSKP